MRGYLADTSALVRIHQRQVAPTWDRVVAAGLVNLCDPVELELLRGARTTDVYLEKTRLLGEAYPWVAVPSDVWTTTRDVQLRLAELSHHQGTSPIDLVVAATAEHHQLVVLHDDADFDAIAKITGQPVQRIR